MICGTWQGILCALHLGAPSVALELSTYFLESWGMGNHSRSFWAHPSLLIETPFHQISHQK